MATQRAATRVIDLTPEHEAAYLVCLEDWPGSDLAEAGDHKARWLARMRDQGLRVKLALDAEGKPVGMIQTVPIERSPFVGEGLEVILCIWVHGHEQGRGNHQGHGLGAALLEAAEADARARGVSGLAAWGLAIPVWMRASWFRRHGFENAGRRGLARLVWKPFTPEAQPPRWPDATGLRPEPSPGKVVVTGCLSGWCPAQNLAFERARRAAAGFGDRVEVREVDTFDRTNLLAWGEGEALWVDGRQVATGPPPSEARLARIIGKRVRKLPATPSSRTPP